MANIAIYKTDYITNILVPFLDNLTWLSKKELDYKDWKIILNIKNQGKHFTEEIISLIVNKMNRRRLTTNLKNPLSYAENEENNLQERIFNLLSSPSNYEIHLNGKIWIKSSGIYLKGRGNLEVEVFNEKEELVYNFSSIKECAQFFNVSDRTINRKLDNGTLIEFNGNKLILKCKVSLP